MYGGIIQTISQYGIPKIWFWQRDVLLWEVDPHTMCIGSRWSKIACYFILAWPIIYYYTISMCAGHNFSIWYLFWLIFFSHKNVLIYKIKIVKMRLWGELSRGIVPQKKFFYVASYTKPLDQQGMSYQKFDLILDNLSSYKGEKLFNMNTICDDDEATMRSLYGYVVRNNILRTGLTPCKDFPQEITCHSFNCLLQCIYGYISGNCHCGCWYCTTSSH